VVGFDKDDNLVTITNMKLKSDAMYAMEMAKYDMMKY